MSERGGAESERATRRLQGIDHARRAQVEHTVKPDEEPAVVVGTRMHDVVHDRVGVVMEVKPQWVFLRPVHGGVEWQAMPEDLEPAAPVDRSTAELRARVAEVNRLSRLGL